MTLRAIREKLGYTQEELAAKLGVGRTTVTMWEIGANMPPTRLLAPLAQVLNCTVDELLASYDETNDRKEG